MTCLWYLTVRENTMTKIATDARYIGLHLKQLTKTNVIFMNNTSPESKIIRKLISKIFNNFTR